MRGRIRHVPALARGRRGRLGLRAGLGLVATTASGELIWSLLHAPAWLAGVSVTQAVALGAVLAVLGRTFRRVRVSRERAAHARTVVRAYVPAPLAESVLDADRARHVAVHRRMLSVLFADLQGFAELTETTEPGALTRALDAYFTATAEAVGGHGGTIHKYLGDGVMVLFGLEPALGECEQALRAVLTGLAIQSAIGRLRPPGDAGAAAAVPLVVRVGVATGMVSVGSIGPEARRDFTAIGPAVNLAARLQGHCSPGSILLDHRTWRLVRDDVRCVPRGDIRVKGFARALSVYEPAPSPTRMP
jgi:class 3 adenylate cyclase